MQQHVVEHRAERVAGVRVGDACGHCFGDGDAERPGVVGVLRQQRPAVVGDVGRAGVHGGAPHLHHRSPVGLLPVRRGDHPDLALHAVLGRRECERTPPLARARLGGQPGDAFGVVVVRLRHRGVRLVRTGGADAFVLVVDARRCAELLLQPRGAEQRARPPYPVHVEHLAGDVDVALRRDLLLDQCHREQRRQVVGPDRLVRARVQRRRRRRRKVGDDVVPRGRHLRLGEVDLVLGRSHEPTT
jgi:hypothetical protein